MCCVKWNLLPQIFSFLPRVIVPAAHLFCLSLVILFSMFVISIVSKCMLFSEIFLFILEKILLIKMRIS